MGKSLSKLPKLRLASQLDDNAATMRAVARLEGRALRENYGAIQDLVPGLSILPMIKAFGYGHGATWVARELLTMSGLYGFGVAALEEGIELRRELGPRGRKAKIVVFSGGPWSEEKGRLCEKHGLVPVISNEADWHLFLRQGWPERLGYEIEFNTGMNRLGLPTPMAPVIAKALRNKPAVWHPDGVLSHLAMGEAPSERLSRTQKEKFIWLKGELQGVFPSTHFHLGNSAAIWNEKQWDLIELTDVVRPGLALYGVPPWKSAPIRGIRPVMTLEAQVLQTHRLKTGDTVGYGTAYRVKGPDPEHSAVLSAGYGDGIIRAMSNEGLVWLHGKHCRIMGNVSMDLCAVRCPEGTRPGEWGQFLGPQIDPWDQAAAAKTIPYELLTSVSPRVQRTYL